MAFSFLKKQAMALAIGAVFALPVMAQDMFGPRLYVNDRVITQYEVMQRVEFLKLLRSPGNLEEEALKGLIEDRLRQTEAKRLKISVTAEEVIAGMNEFAARANLTADQLIEELAKVDISAETFRDFVSAGLLWRKAVRARFGGRVQVSEADIDKVIEASTRPRALRVLLSELIIPLPDGNADEALALATELSETLSGEGAFSAAVSRYSKAPTASRGGRLEWLPLSNLPAAVGGAVLALGPGEVSEPVIVPGAVALFMLRDVATDNSAEPIAVSVEWAEFLVPDDATEIGRIIATSDTCVDLYKHAGDLPEDRLTVTKAPMASIPSDVGLELAKLDAGETSVALTRGSFRRLLMLCGREVTQEEEINRSSARESVLNQKLEGMAEAYLEELRSAAIIREL